MEGDNMPPKPDCEFDFDLPHGIDTEQGGSNSDDHQRTVEHLHANERHDDEHYHNSMEYIEHLCEPDRHQNDHGSMEDVLHTTQTTDDLDLDDQNYDEHDMNHGTFTKGFSDDDDDDPEAAFDHAWAGHQARRPPRKNEKSPRRSNEDSENEASPKTKRPRPSLFGGLAEEDGEKQSEDYLVEQDDAIDEPKTPGQAIRYRMSSLNLEQQERERSLSERPFSLGFGLASSNRGSVSRRASPALSEDSVVIPPDDLPSYELRQNIERKKAFTYIDTDKSGNFDPEEEARRKTLKLNKAKASKAAQQKKGKGKARAPKENVMKCIVKLRFEAFGNVRNYTNDEDNWPEDWSDIDSDCEREMQEFRDFYRRNTPGRELQKPIEDPSDIVDDLTGYPAARGCMSCRKHDQDCSMIEDGTYPCTYCIEDNSECEPIIPPTIKGSCKQCAVDGMDFCSFEDDPDQAICDHCAENEYICEPLPPQGYKTERIDIYEIIGGEDRQYIQCTVCRQEKKRCSLKKKTDKPPCKYCKKHNIGCTFFDLPKQVDSRTAGSGKGKGKGPTEGDAPEVAMPGSDYFTTEDLADMDMRDDEMTSREATPEMEMEDNAGRKGMLTRIKTSFAHPIQFSAPVQDVSDCNFCEMPLFGITGHFEREVHVIRWHNGLGFSEVGGGFCEDKGPTKMCESCTVTRLQTFVCPGHEIQRIFDDDSAQDFDTVTDELISAEPGSPEMQYQLQRWCSMCFSIATYGCARLQPSLCGEEETEVVGCGLRLCDRCELAMREEFDGDADLMATEMENMPKLGMEDELNGSFEGRARADVGFLRKDGLLMMHTTCE